MMPDLFALDVDDVNVDDRNPSQDVVRAYSN